MTQPKTSKSKNRAAVALGKRGGMAGTGDAKRRKADHYARIAKLGVEARKKKALGVAEG